MYIHNTHTTDTHTTDTHTHTNICMSPSPHSPVSRELGLSNAFSSSCNIQLFESVIFTYVFTSLISASQ